MPTDPVWPLSASVLVLVLLGAVTVVAGVRIATTADRLADRLGWGEALFGAIVFGAVTSLSGIVMTAPPPGTGARGRSAPSPCCC